MRYLFPLFKKSLSALLAEKEHIYERYNLSYCLILIHTQKEMELNFLKNYLRLSDIVVMSDDPHFWAVLFYLPKGQSPEAVEDKVLFLLKQADSTNHYAIGSACRHFEDDVLTQALQHLLIAMQKDKDSIED